METLSNGKISIRISRHGAELTSILANGIEYLWQGDPKYWGRHSPVLFPIVGRVWNEVYRHNGKEYTLNQHGFARDMDFQLIQESETEVTYRTESNDDTLKNYPFPFVLEVGYRIRENTIEVMWRVTNPGQTDMYFQIGAHPAFYYRDLDTSTDKRGYLDFGPLTSSLEYEIPVEKGCVSPERHRLPLPGGLMELTPQAFACDTYVFDNSQLQKITLTDKHKRPYVSVEFHTPLVAVWSPAVAHPDAPFVCIEPWFGRCDYVGYSGEFKDRKWMQCLTPGNTFRASYTITLDDVE